jgi:hypothetical protein
MARIRTVIALLAVSLASAPVLAQGNPPAPPKPPSEADIQAAIDRGVEFLKQAQDKEGYWRHTTTEQPGQSDVGATALCALALLESGVPKSDPCITRAAAYIRSKLTTLTHTYSLSLVILFIDRYAGKEEAKAIGHLALRLAAGQNQQTGGWPYSCPQLKNPNEQIDWIRKLNANRRRIQFGMFPTEEIKEDNSNTQFAIIALWVARRYGFAAEHPLALAEWRFRNTQNEDGGWSYRPRAGGSTPAMTCSGLLGLVIGYGNARARQANLRSSGTFENPDEGKPPPLGDIRIDKQVQAAKAFLGKRLTNNAAAGQILYFAWSLERVGVAYGFDELNGKKWYDWGAGLLVPIQAKDGSWPGSYQPPINTSFALLFLRRANFTADLRSDPKTDTALRAGDRPRAGDDAPAEAKKLLAELTAAGPERQAEILKRLEETIDPSGSYTQALIDAIAALKGEPQQKARDALAERLSRLTANSLRSWLQDRNAEARQAAARASALSADIARVPDLIPLLTDPSDTVAAAAEKALQDLTKEDLGRDPARWKEYWSTRKR